MVIKPFQVTGISLALDGSENHLLRNKTLLQALSLEEREEEEQEKEEEGQEECSMLTLKTNKWKKQMFKKTPLVVCTGYSSSLCTPVTISCLLPLWFL